MSLHLDCIYGEYLEGDTDFKGGLYCSNDQAILRSNGQKRRVVVEGGKERDFRRVSFCHHDCTECEVGCFPWFEI